MRAELPWNVAGIPPEAREAVRAAARREGLSVGEWMTRRILRSFSMEEDVPSLAYERRPSEPRDSWDLPQRRDTDDMMARVGRSENESNEVWRRIEDQLRGLDHRPDYSGRGEATRAAQETHVSAKAFDQLGLHVMALNARLERLERGAAHEGIREAVKALHQGLSRLADQITATTNNSATQLLQLNGNLEQLAGRVGQARLDSENADKALVQRIDNSARAMEARLSAAEKAAQFNAEALGHALGKIEAGTNQRATDQAENQRRTAQHADSLDRLEEAIARLEIPDLQFERRLESAEHALSTMRLEQSGESGSALSQRLAALEKDHADLMGELRAKVLRSVVRPVEAPADTAAEPTLAEEVCALDAPTLAEPLIADAVCEEVPMVLADTAEAMDAPLPQSQDFIAPDEIPPDSDPDEPAVCEEVSMVLADTAEAVDAPLQESQDFIAPDEIPPDSDPDASDLAEIFAAIPGEPETVLDQAHRAAHAAAQEAESERRAGFTAFRWGQDAAANDVEKPKSRRLIAVLVALIVALAAIAALVLSQRAAMPAQAAIVRPPGRIALASPASKDIPLAVAPQASAQPQDDVHGAPVAAAPVAAKTSTRLPLDRVIQLANSGNPTTLTILGLRALDGTGGAAVSLPDAVRFLTQAAEKGQAVAQYRLATLYQHGQGVAADPVQAAQWYETAAAQGNRKAMHNLAISFADGAAGKKDMAEAALWFAKAAALGLPDSQFNLAVLYETGAGVPQSLAGAYQWYAIAAASGDGESKARLGLLQARLSDADKAAASKAAASFHAAPLDRAANVPPQPADLGM
jgi:localization factor PodJL